MTIVRPWLDNYPEGVARDVDTGRYESISRLCSERCAAEGDRIAYENMGASLSFADVERDSRRFAAFLTNDLGLARGDRVAIMLPNLLQSPIVVFGILRAGLIVVNVNPLYTAPELEHQLTDSGAKAIVVLENFAATLAAAMPATSVEHVVIARVGDCLGRPRGWIVDLVVKYVRRQVPPWKIDGALTFRSALAGASTDGYEDPDLGPNDIAFLQYTGGTTGVAKGAMLSHGNVVANVQQLIAWVEPHVERGRDVALTPLPLYHIFALTVNLFAFLELGLTNVLVTNPRDMRGLVRELGRGNFTFMTGVNTLFNGILHAPDIEKLDLSGLRIALAGGMAVQKDVAEQWRRLTGHTLVQGYGLTETSPVVSACPLDQPEFNGSIGMPLPATDVAILDDAGQPLPLNEPGELCVKGPQVMQGYWNRPEETRDTMTADGWLRTGDIARMDDSGFLFIEDRKKDVIIVSGFNVYPNEVEDVVVSHPAVVEAAAIGVPSERSGEAVKIFVVRKDSSLSEEALLDFCRESLTGYKSPDIVEFVDDLPKSNVGKILRRKLKE